ncbi:tetratricopeptide repeat protein [Kitasatospora sp. NPDC056327]|uniref:tetratricopeptide repeat protein n=1 Tax=Kitasatospora sp. NPDC056327 TaxID=3345785 RepID=UPI0035DDE681
MGRRDELALFREALQQPPEELAQFLFHVHGPGGVGKSTLVRQLENAARDAGAVTGYVDEAVTDAVEAMRAVGVQLAQQGAPLKRLDRLLATYRQRRHEAAAGAAAASGATAGPAGGALTPSAGPADGEAPSGPAPATVIASRIGLVGMGMIPGVGAFTGALDPNQVAASAEQLRGLLSARFRSHDDAQLVLSPLQVLTPVFLQDLAEAAQRRPWLVLLLDTYERTGPLLDEWLRDVLVTDRYGELPANVLVVTAGRARLDPRHWGDWHDVVADLPLEPFTEAEARRLLAASNVTDERTVEVILRLSGRLPLLVSTLAEARPADAADVGDPSGTAVERFLRWETEPARRAAALACALPQELDEDVYRAAVDDPQARELFRWLRSMPFVIDRAGRCHYHDVVRTAMLRLQRRQSPARWQEQHTRLADTFRQWQDRTGERRWRDDRWRAHRLQETYHRLCADPRRALPHALRDLLNVQDYDPEALRRWAQTLQRAGRDADAAEVGEWGERLLTAVADPHPGLAVLTLLVSHAELDPAGRAYGHRLRGRSHVEAGAYDRALTDFGAALALEPGSTGAFRGRGITLHLAGRHEEALADFDRVVADDPGDHEVIATRAETYRLLRRYEEALADFDRAVGTAPRDSWIVASRGETYYGLGRYEEALADFDRAVGIDPDRDWIVASRGETFRVLERHEEALADLDRAVALNGDYAWAIASRGETHHAAGRYEEALADLDRAIGLAPEYQWAIGKRGAVLAAVGRYEEALADFDRSLELVPGDVQRLGDRGQTLRMLGRHEEALADLDRAVALAPDVGWLIVSRALVHRLLGRYEEASAGLDRAIGLEQDAWYHYEKAVVLHALGDPGRDAQLARVVELVGSAPAGPLSHTIADLGNLFLVHCLTARRDEAERGFEDLLRLGPPAGRIAELAADLADLARLAPPLAAGVAGFRQRLAEALPESAPPALRELLRQDRP